MKNPFEQTYCNPLSLPDYMTMTKDGAFSECFYPTTGRWQEGNEARFEIFPRDYRSESDPDIIFYEGKWYLYGGMDRCYSSADMLHWETHLLDVDCLDASTVPHCKRTKQSQPLPVGLRLLFLLSEKVKRSVSAGFGESAVASKKTIRRRAFSPLSDGFSLRYDRLRAAILAANQGITPAGFARSVKRRPK